MTYSKRRNPKLSCPGKEVKQTGGVRPPPKKSQNPWESGRKRLSGKGFCWLLARIRVCQSQSKIRLSSGRPIYYDGERLHDLGELGGQRAETYDINNQGQIVGTGRFDGGERGYVLTPIDVVPEPTALALLAGAFPTLWVAQRWRRGRRKHVRR